MDINIKNVIAQHEDYQRLQKVFSLDFVVECLTNSRRGVDIMISTARYSGALLRQLPLNPTLYPIGVHYHELVELEEFRKMGYTDEQLGDNHSEDPNFELAHLEAKRKELEFYQFIVDKIIGTRPPFLSWPFSHLAAAMDFAIQTPSYDELYRGIEKRKFKLYKEPFVIKDVQDGIILLKRGGNICSGEQTALTYASDYLSGRKLVPRVEPWQIA